MTAVASALQARASGGEWLLRIEDIDPPRQVPGAAEQIIASLEAHGFAWPGEVYRQSANRERHLAVIHALLESGRAYRCDCSREQLRGAADTGPAGPIYPGRCRDRTVDPTTPHAIRLRTDFEPTRFRDRVQGWIDCDVRRDIGDFVIRRKDGLVAYGLAVVVDDADQRISEVVRGADLLALTPAQILLQRRLGFPTPAYAHVPIVVNASGEKLSKQTGAEPVDDGQPAANLRRCLEFLGQRPPAELGHAPLPEAWSWALDHWAPGTLRRAPRGAAR